MAMSIDVYLNCIIVIALWFAVEIFYEVYLSSNEIKYALFSIECRLWLVLETSHSLKMTIFVVSGNKNHLPTLPMHVFVVKLVKMVLLTPSIRSLADKKVYLVTSAVNG